MAVRQIAEHDDGETRERLKLVGIEPAPQRDDPLPTVPVKTAPPTREAMDRVMIAVARILGFRLQLLLAFLGAVSLSGVAVAQGSVMGLSAATLFDILIFLPVLYVAMKRG